MKRDLAELQRGLRWPCKLKELKQGPGVHRRGAGVGSGKGSEFNRSPDHLNATVAAEGINTAGYSRVPVAAVLGACT